MKSTDAPTKTTVPFASSAGSNYIRTVPVPSQIGTTDGAASYTDGFPPDTFVNEAAGGYPPNGRDINYLLNVISAWDRWVAAGGSPVYDSTFSSAIGGYPNGAVLRMSDGGGFWISTVDDNTSDPDSGGANWSVLALSQTKLDARYVLSDADGSGLNKIIVSGNITLTQADSGKFIDPWSAPAGTVITLPFSGTVVPSGWNVTIGPNQNPLTIKNDTTSNVLSPDGGALIAPGGGTWSKPTGAGAPLYLHEYDALLLAITTGRTIIADAVNNNEAVALGQGDGRYAFSNTVQDLTSSRALGTTYTNSAGHPIWINVRTSDAGGGIHLNAVINGVTWKGSSMNSGANVTEGASVSAPVPPGATYIVNSSDTLVAWVEYR